MLVPILRSAADTHDNCQALQSSRDCTTSPFRLAVAAQVLTPACHMPMVKHSCLLHPNLKGYLHTGQVLQQTCANYPCQDRDEHCHQIWRMCTWGKSV